MLHGLGTGTDVKSWWMLALTVACVVAVLVAVLVRVARTPTATPGVRTGAAAAAIIRRSALAIFTLAGPLAHGWARSAGTPAKLLGAAPHRPRPAATPVSRTPLRAPARQARSRRRSPAAHPDQRRPSGAIVELSMRLSGGADGQLRVRLGGAPLPSGGLSMTGSQVDLDGAGTALGDGRADHLADRQRTSWRA